MKGQTHDVVLLKIATFYVTFRTEKILIFHFPLLHIVELKKESIYIILTLIGASGPSLLDSPSMGENSGKFEVEKLITYSDELIECLKNERDSSNLKQCLEQSKILQSQCDADFNNVQSSLQDYQKKIDMCKQRTDAAKSEVADDTKLDLLQKELEEELQRESLLREELRVIASDINDLECQRLSVEERRQSLKKLEKHDMRSQMKLSMYASITNIIPNLDEQSKISGHIVERDKKVVQNFEFDPLKMNPFDTCNHIWKMIDL